MRSQIRVQGIGNPVYANPPVHHFIKDLKFVANVDVPKPSFKSNWSVIKQNLQIYKVHTFSPEGTETLEMGAWSK